MLKIINPTNAEVLTELETDDHVSIIEKYNRSMAAQLEWARTSLAEREAIILDFRALLIEQKDLLINTMAEETGKPVQDGAREIVCAVDMINFYVHNYRKISRRQLLRQKKGHVDEITGDPLGVVVHISCSSQPIMIAINTLVPALLTGNAVLYKPSEHASLTGMSLVQLFYEAGMRDEILVPILGDSFAGMEMLKWPVQGVFFTGGARAGRQIADICARRYTYLQMELFGSNAAYVCADADIEATARNLAGGILRNCGQNHLSVDRVLVEESIYTKFRIALMEAFQEYKPGDPLDPTTQLGPLNHADRVRELNKRIEFARANQANILQLETDLPTKGNYFAPTLIANIGPDYDDMDRPLVGPAAYIVPVLHDAQASGLINQSPSGLAASVYTPDEKRARQFMHHLMVGVVYWNCCQYTSAHMPRSGLRESGVGTTQGMAGLRSFVRPRAWYMREEIQ